MRVVLFTGKGGVGKSTVAAGTAALCAAAGHRTLVLSTDAAHSLADAFGAPVGPEPTEVAPGLFVQQVDAQLRFQQSWAEIQRYLLAVLDVAGVDPVAAEELTVIPGAEEVLALLELRQHARSERWDVVIVDCAPTAETLRLLALPEALGWYMQRVFPVERRIVKALKPVLSRAAGVPMPEDDVFAAVERLHRELDEVRALLSGPGSSIRLVLTPENVVLAEARRSYTTLSLFGYRVDGVVANRVFPAEGADDWRAGWVLAQDEVLAQVAQSFAGLPVWTSLYRPAEPVGVDALRRPRRGGVRRRRPGRAPHRSGPVPHHALRVRHGAAAGPAAGLESRRRSRQERRRARRDRRVVSSSSHASRRARPAPCRRRPGGGRGATGEVRGERVVSEPSDGVGSLAEEAAKLLGALSGLAREHGADLGEGMTGLADKAAAAAHDLDRHIATGGEDCVYCPVCRAIHLVRQTSPEVRAHLAVAASSLVQAAAGMLATDPAGEPAYPRRGRAHRPRRRRAARRPRRVRATPRRHMSLTIGVDVGGTKIAGGVVDEQGNVLEQLRVESPAQDPEAIEEAIAGLVARLRGRHEVTAVGVGAAGYIDSNRSKVYFAPNVAWRDVDLRGRARGADRPAGGHRERRQRRGVGRVPLRRRRGRGRPAC